MNSTFAITRELADLDVPYQIDVFKARVVRDFDILFGGYVAERLTMALDGLEREDAAGFACQVFLVDRARRNCCAYDFLLVLGLPIDQILRTSVKRPYLNRVWVLGRPFVENLNEVRRVLSRVLGKEKTEAFCCLYNVVCGDVWRGRKLIEEILRFRFGPVGLWEWIARDMRGRTFPRWRLP